MKSSDFHSIANSQSWKKGLAHLRKSDPVLSRLITRHKIPPIELRKDLYGALIRSIIFQQISGKAGASILKKFKGLYGNSIPTPKEFLSTPEKKVKSAGISPQKYSYLVDLSERILDGRLELKKFHRMDNDSVVTELDEVRGIGRWTAEMFLMFVLGRTDVLPVDDLGLQKGLRKVYGLRTLPSEERFRKIASRWHPYCTIACLYLWRSMDAPEPEKPKTKEDSWA